MVFRSILQTPILVIFFLAACAAPTPPYGDPNILFKDDFSQPTSGWTAHTASDLTADYADGRYLVVVEDVGLDAWGTANLDLTDATVEVDTAYGAGPDNNLFGVMCRYTKSDNKKNFYFFRISSDGYFALGKVVKDVVTTLNPPSGEYAPSEAIHPKGDNHLAATCAGNKFSLAVNGSVVGEFEDNDLSHGDIGLSAGTLFEGGVKIYFDNVVVRKP